MAGYVHTDECHDVLASLEHCGLSLRQTRRSDRAWKWVILSLHSALQGAMVCHLSSTAQLGALTKNSAEKWLEWYEKKGQNGRIPHIQERVANAEELFIRLSCPSKRIEGGCGAPIEITKRQRMAFKRLNNLRNEFSHFSPKGWDIELEFIEEIIEDILYIVCLIQKDQWPFRHMPEENKSFLRSTIEEIRSILSRSPGQG